MNTLKTHTLQNWGNTIHMNARVLRPATISDLQFLIAHTSETALAYGCGRSYGDVALNDTTLIHTALLNRFIAFDPQKCELICEAGVTLRDIQMTFLPRGFALITSPGTAEVTVGGAIANDAHGKNHDTVGSFGNHVVWFELLLSDGDIIRCSKTENSAIFFATIGGIGLTGIITRVCLRLQKHPLCVRVQNEYFDNIPAVIARLYEIRHSVLYSVAWVDLLSNNFGHSVLSTAKPDDNIQTLSFSKKVFVPNVASIFLNRITMRFYNRWHGLKTKNNTRQFIQSLPVFLYPLDAIANWNVLYGKKGFFQFQCVIPDAYAQSGIAAIIEYVSKQTQKPYLTVLKTLGSNGVGLMSFPCSGLTLAMDFPNNGDVTKALFNALAGITLQHHGKIYLAKDACLTTPQFEKMYPNLSTFRSVINEIDKKRLWSSLLAKRLSIV